MFRSFALGEADAGADRVPQQGTNPAPPRPPPAASDFALKLGSSNAGAFQGASGLLRVTLEGKNGFAGEVQTGLQNPPEGVTVSTTTIKTARRRDARSNSPPARAIRAYPQADRTTLEVDMANFTKPSDAKA
jgi:hypothetical protein